MDEDPQGMIPKAGQLLTTLAFCRSQAEALHACNEKGGKCSKENDIFLKCATDSAPLVVETMVKLAIKHCPEEVQAHQRCVKVLGKKQCKDEDLAAMWCASQQVMRAAAEETRER